MANWKIKLILTEQAVRVELINESSPFFVKRR
jgi:hypothetical protein